MSFPRTPAAILLIAATASIADAQTLQSTTSNLLAVDDVEITPDQRYAVVRVNHNDRYVRVYDLSTGALAASPAVGSFGALCGECLDAVAVTNTRAIVLGGAGCAIVDLTNLASPILAEHAVGFRPNDVAITPDGTIGVVRGGNTDGLATGGTYLYRMSTGAQIGFSAGFAPRYNYGSGPNYSFNTDSVAVTDRYAVTLALAADVNTAPAFTRVTIWDLHPSGGGAPAVILQTGSAGRSDLSGAPHDVGISPDGTHVVVRSELALGVWTLANGTATRIFAGALTNDPGPFFGTAMDSIEVTDDLVVTLANVGTQGNTQVEVFDWNGGRWSGVIGGWPHDLAVTPDGTRALVRTTTGLALYRLVNLPGGGALNPLEFLSAPTANAGYEAGLDSVAATNDFAVTLSQMPNFADSRASFWSIARGDLELLSSTLIPNSRPTDIVITPDARRAVVTGNASISVFHVGTGGRSFEHHPVGATAFYQWCDGAAASADRAVGVGQWAPQSGWVDLVSTAPFSTRYCASNPNSSGRTASILALGNASVSSNSLKLCVDGAPRNARGRFVYGPTQAQLPFGDGVQCVGGPVFGLRFLETNVAGSGFAPVNYGAQGNPAGVVLPGSTWHYQFVFLDQGSSGFGVNSSDALTITFAP